MKYHFYACKKCDYRPVKAKGDDWVQTNHSSRNLAWPKRCTKCDTDYRRAKRTAIALKKLDSISFYNNRNLPKLLTVGLPSYPGDDYPDLMKRLRKGWSQLRKRLLDEGVIAGKYVIECTRKICFDTFLTKWHPHIHAVVVGPYRTDLAEFGNISFEYGLGRMDYRAVRNLKHVARYISKYITKQEGYRSASWGELIGYYAPHVEWIGEYPRTRQLGYRYKWRAKTYVVINYHIFVLKSLNR